MKQNEHQESIQIEPIFQIISKRKAEKAIIGKKKPNWTLLLVHAGKNMQGIFLRESLEVNILLCFFFLLSNPFLQSHFFLCCFCVGWGWVLSPSRSACGLSVVLKSSSRPSLFRPSLSISVTTAYFIFCALSLHTCKANFEKLWRFQSRSFLAQISSVTMKSYHSSVKLTFKVFIVLPYSLLTDIIFKFPSLFTLQRYFQTLHWLSVIAVFAKTPSSLGLKVSMFRKAFPFQTCQTLPRILPSLL